MKYLHIIQNYIHLLQKWASPSLPYGRRPLSFLFSLFLVITMGLGLVVFLLAPVGNDLAQAQNVKQLRICVQQCNAQRNQCFSGGAKAGCRKAYNQCVLQCQRHLNK